ncbi:hypothetical protein [Sessilibacter sp. MAH4]
MSDELYFITGAFSVGSMRSRELHETFRVMDIESKFDESSVMLFQNVEISMDKGLCSFSSESADMEFLRLISSAISEALKNGAIHHQIEVTDGEWNTIHVYKL